MFFHIIFFFFSLLSLLFSWKLNKKTTYFLTLFFFVYFWIILFEHYLFTSCIRTKEFQLNCLHELMSFIFIMCTPHTKTHSSYTIFNFLFTILLFITHIFYFWATILLKCNFHLSSFNVHWISSIFLFLNGFFILLTFTISMV